MPVNVLLCRWIGGWREVRHEASIATYGRREALLGLGAIQSPQEVDRMAGEQLAIFADQRTAIAADVEPMSTADRPYRAWNVGDTITVPDYGGGTIAQRVRSLTGSEDDNGEITYSPELGDLILEAQERHEQAIKKMADGTLDGESPVATPVAQTQQPQKVFGGAPFPATGGFKVSSGGPLVGEYTGSSEVWNGGDGGGDYTLISFKITVPESHQVDGAPTFFELRNFFGDISYTKAEIDLGVYVDGGTHEGTILNSNVQVGSGWQMNFNGGGQWGGPFTVEAVFAQPGDDIVLTWYPQGS